MSVKNIMIVGVGGQGTLLTSRVLGGLTIAGGYDVKLSEVHGMAQRGGSVVTFVRYGDKVAEPIVEEGQADVIIAFERLEALRYAHFLKKDGALVVNDWRIDHAGGDRKCAVSGKYSREPGKGISGIHCGRDRGGPQAGKSEGFQYDCSRSGGTAHGFHERPVVQCD